MRVPILRIPFGDVDRAFIAEGIDRILTSGQLTLGPYTEQFEREFAEFCGTRHAVAVSNGTAALEILLRTSGLEDRDVIVPANTFVATAFAVIHSGNRVQFADCDPETFSLDPADVQRRITDRTGAVVVVHVGGVISRDIEKIQKICSARNLILIEDCAHAHGCSLQGRSVGTLGLGGAFSFFPTKVLTTGEGGVIVTNDVEVDARARMIRNHGKNPALGGRMSEVGHNQRLPEMGALMGVQQLRRAADLIERRQTLARFYDDALSDIDGIAPLAVPESTVSTYYKYVVVLDPAIDRDALKSRMATQFGVSFTGEVYRDPCHTEPVWSRYTYCGWSRERGLCAHGTLCDRSEDGFEGAEWIGAHHVCLPLYPDLSPAEAEHVVESLRKAL